MPDATTLIKLTHRLGPKVIEQLNETLMAQLVEKRVIKRHGQRIRVDTTVVAEVDRLILPYPEPAIDGAGQPVRQRI